MAGHSLQRFRRWLRKQSLCRFAADSQHGWIIRYTDSYLNRDGYTVELTDDNERVITISTVNWGAVYNTNASVEQVVSRINTAIFDKRVTLHNFGGIEQDSVLQATIDGAATGLGHGATILANQLTFELIPSLDEYADKIVAENAHLHYGVAVGSATIARESLIALLTAGAGSYASAASAAGTTGIAVTSARVMVVAGKSYDVYETVVEGKQVFVAVAQGDLRQAAFSSGLVAINVIGLKADIAETTEAITELAADAKKFAGEIPNYRLHVDLNRIGSTGGNISIGKIDATAPRGATAAPVRRLGRAPEFPAGRLHEDVVLDRAIDYLGPGYRELSPGRYVSADGLRQFRYGAHEVRNPANHHAHFEALDEFGRVIENSVVEIFR